MRITVKALSAERETRKEELTIGVDWGDRSSRYRVVDEHGDVLLEGGWPPRERAWIEYLEQGRAVEWR